MCENIHYFVKDNHKIIIHTNPEIDEETRNLTKQLDYVYIFPKPFRKKKHNSILWKSHIENFESFRRIFFTGYPNSIDVISFWDNPPKKFLPFRMEIH